VTSDRNNCGACGNACGDDQVCLQGTCTDCAPSQTRCGNACVDLQTNASNCGGCGIACSYSAAHASSTCVGGTCGLSCYSGFLDCDSNALDGCETVASSKHCGTCGTACTQGQFCSQTKCAACSPLDLGSSVPVTSDGTTVGRTDQFVTTCGSAGRSDAYFSFTAATAGSYKFTVTASSSTAVVQVLAGACEGTSLGCASSYTGQQVTATLAAKQTVTIIVEGIYTETPFTLTVQ
jgi:hypothetical protein